MHKLTKMQLLFAQGLAAGKNARQAAIDAGSKDPDVRAWKWQKLEKVKDEVARLTGGAAAKLARKGERDAKRWQEMLWEHAEGLADAEIVHMPKFTLRKQRPLEALALLGKVYAPERKLGPRVQVNVLAHAPAELKAQVYLAMIQGANGNGNGNGAS
jgi:phage terminase small subunit